MNHRVAHVPSSPPKHGSGENHEYDKMTQSPKRQNEEAKSTIKRSIDEEEQDPSSSLSSNQAFQHNYGLDDNIKSSDFNYSYRQRALTASLNNASTLSSQTMDTSSQNSDAAGRTLLDNNETIASQSDLLSSRVHSSVPQYDAISFDDNSTAFDTEDSRYDEVRVSPRRKDPIKSETEASGSRVPDFMAWMKEI